MEASHEAKTKIKGIFTRSFCRVAKRHKNLFRKVISFFFVVKIKIRNEFFDVNSSY